MSREDHRYPRLSTTHGQCVRDGSSSSSSVLPEYMKELILCTYLSQNSTDGALIWGRSTVGYTLLNSTQPGSQPRQKPSQRPIERDDWRQRPAGEPGLPHRVTPPLLVPEQRHIVLGEDGEELLEAQLLDRSRLQLRQRDLRTPSPTTTPAPFSSADNLRLAEGVGFRCLPAC